MSKKYKSKYFMLVCLLATMMTVILPATHRQKKLMPSPATTPAPVSSITDYSIFTMVPVKFGKIDGALVYDGPPGERAGVH
jgi:uncharacterized membrane protein